MTTRKECDRCQRFSGYLGDEFLVCAVHPSGPTQTPCPDFAEVVEDCVPVGAAYYNGELILDSPAYLTTAERLACIIHDKYQKLKILPN
ncbi:MAG: hypothetical protein HC852_24100 [Acaryochloridaceae cyanobacterium RU_4_10]|nr:hypothetical protein [Acaryochloridaceae cyanobacterium RU_4_10]